MSSWEFVERKFSLVFTQITSLLKSILRLKWVEDAAQSCVPHS